jgi:hypothetical protein
MEERPKPNEDGRGADIDAGSHRRCSRDQGETYEAEEDAESFTVRRKQRIFIQHEGGVEAKYKDSYMSPNASDTTPAKPFEHRQHDSKTHHDP